MERVLRAVMWVSLVLLAGGAWTENFAVGRMQREDWYRRQGWKRFFISTKRVIAAHKAAGGNPKWIRLQKIASTGTLVGFAAMLTFVIAACILASH